MDHRARYVLFVSSVAAVGGLLYGYDTGVISGAILFIQESFKLDTQMQELAVSVVLIGAIAGAFLSGGASDQFGRRLTLIAAGVIFAAGALLSAFAGSIAALLIGRVIVGVAIGISSVTAPLYISEAAPRQTRGALVSLYQFAITIGILAAALVDYVLSSSANWGLMLGIAIVPSVLLVAGMIMLPESPRWLFAHGQEARGREVLMRTRAPEEIDEAIADIESSLGVHQGEFKDLFSPPVRTALGIGIALAILQQITGINTVIYYGPQIFKAAGFSSDAVSILATLGVDTVNCLMTIVARRTDRPRRPQAVAVRRRRRYGGRTLRPRLCVLTRRERRTRSDYAHRANGLRRLLRVQSRTGDVADHFRNLSAARARPRDVDRHAGELGGEFRRLIRFPNDDSRAGFAADVCDLRRDVSRHDLVRPRIHSRDEESRTRQHQRAGARRHVEVYCSRRQTIVLYALGAFSQNALV